MNRINLTELLAEALCQHLADACHDACSQYECCTGCLLEHTHDITIKDLQKYVEENKIEFDIR